MNKTVLISYSSKDRGIVDKLEVALQAEGVEALDALTHQPEMWGAPVLDYLRDVIATRADGVLLVLSENYSKSRWCKMELTAIEALCKEGPDAPLLLPIRIDDSPVPEQLRDRIYLDLGIVSLEEAAKAARERLASRAAPETRLAALSDEDLYKKFLESRDPVVINLLFERLYPTVRASCFRYGLTKLDAEDVAQDTLASLLRRASSYGEVRDFDAFVRRLARNSAVRVYRRNATQWEVPLPESPAEDMPGVQSAVGRREISAKSRAEKLLQLVSLAKEALEQLPADERKLVKLHLVEGMSDDDLARLFSVSVPMVRVRIHRVLDSLRKELQLSRSHD